MTRGRRTYPDDFDFEELVEERALDRHDPDRDDDHYENWLHGENR